MINDLNIINCEQHGSLFAEKFENFIVKLMVHNWCTEINRILSGKISIAKNENDLVKLSAYYRYQTFCKKPNSR